ncbi:MAG: ABC transporter permease [Synergistaceae bacterium]|jgi:sulfonate transport system permease protein|nr:ABC transporter permease [Synergistaceae bacterium]
METSFNGVETGRKSVCGASALMRSDAAVNSLINRYLIPLALPIVIIAFWQYVCDSRSIPMLLLPSPARIAGAFVKLIADRNLIDNLTISLLRVGQGYCLGASLGITLGCFMGLFPIFERMMSLITGILRPIPIMAWVPLMILWVGIGELSKIILIAIGTFWAVLVSVINGIKNTDRKYLEVAYIFKKNKITLMRKVIFPAMLPFVFSGLRIGIDNAWRSVVGAEVVASISGVGFMIQFAREVSRTDIMFVGIFTVGLVGICIDQLLKFIQKKLLKWDQTLGSSV